MEFSLEFGLFVKIKKGLSSKVKNKLNETKIKVQKVLYFEF